MQNVTGEGSNLNAGCLAAHSAETRWRCFMAQDSLPFVKTPLFAVQSVYDAWQGVNILGVSPNCLRAGKTACKPAEVSALDGLRAAIMGNISSAPSTVGYFLYDCATHCGYLDKDSWNDLDDGANSLRESISLWMRGKMVRSTGAAIPSWGPRAYATCTGMQAGDSAVGRTIRPATVEVKSDDSAAGQRASKAVITVRRDQIVATTDSGLMAGAALEFLNHQAYGGLSSQMIMGESFEESPFYAYSSGRTIGCGIADVQPHPGPGPAPAPVPPGQGCKVSQLTNDTKTLNPYCQHNAVVRTNGLCNVKCPGSGAVRADHCTATGWEKTIAQLCGTEDPDLSLAPNASVSAMWHVWSSGGAAAEFSIMTEGVIHGRQAQRVTKKEDDDGLVSITNHGLDCQWGMYLEAGQPYDGYLYARLPPSTSAEHMSVVVSVAFVEFDMSTWQMGGVLGEVELTIDEAGWGRYNFSLTPKEGTSCSTVSRRLNATTSGEPHIACNGSLRLALHTAGTIDLDMVLVQPGEWSRLKTADGVALPTRRDLAEALLGQSHFSVMRMGGSMANSVGYRWKEFVGRYDQRQPYRALWYRDRNCDDCLVQSRGWGMFELIDMCEVFGVTAIVTFNNDETPQDMADFVEFAHADASTEWGRRRIALGHPKPYAVTMVELGNEQGLDTGLAAQFAAIAHAMDARVGELQLPFNFSYVFGPRPDLSSSGHWSHNWSDPGLAAVADAIAPFGNQSFWDLHVESKTISSVEGDPAGAQQLAKFLKARGSATRAVVLEENGCGFSHHCALNHAVLANGYRRIGEFVRANSITNALEAYDHIETYSQGMISFLPNATIRQPTFHANAMFAENDDATTELNTTITGAEMGADGGLLLNAGVGLVQGAEDVMVVRVVHFGTQPTNVSLVLLGMPFAKHSVTADVKTLAGALDAKNTPAAPNKIAPVRSVAALAVVHVPQGVGFRVELPIQPTSVTIFRVPLGAG